MRIRRVCAAAPFAAALATVALSAPALAHPASSHHAGMPGNGRHCGWYAVHHVRGAHHYGHGRACPPQQGGMPPGPPLPGTYPPPPPTPQPYPQPGTCPSYGVNCTTDTDDVCGDPDDRYGTTTNGTCTNNRCPSGDPDDQPYGTPGPSGDPDDQPYGAPGAYGTTCTNGDDPCRVGDPDDRSTTTTYNRCGDDQDRSHGDDSGHGGRRGGDDGAGEGRLG